MGRILLVSIVLLFLFSCKPKNNSYEYELSPGEKSTYTFKLNETDSSDCTLHVYTNAFSMEKDKPFGIQLKVESERRYAEGLINADMQLFGKNAAGEYKDEVKADKTYSSVRTDLYYYYDDPSRKLNYTDSLFKLIEIQDEQNTPDRVNTFYIDKEYKPASNPEDIEAVIKLKWIGGEKKFTVHYKLRETYTSKPRSRPFG
ncbi:MAG TPA: hypothetical protein VGF30_07670 [Bacteroidia bacterium]